MGFMRHMVLTSSKDTQADEEIDVNPYRLSTECDGKPSLVEIVFVRGDTTYRYGFEADRKRIHSEWLFTVPSIREAELFTREGQHIRVNASRFKEGKGLEDKTRENALFLSVCAQFNGELSKSLLLWFREFKFVSGLSDFDYLTVTVDKLGASEHKNRILELTKVADLSITDLEGRKEKWTMESLPRDMPEELKREIIKQEGMLIELKTLHRKFGKNNKEIGKVAFDLEEDESGGTQKLLALAGPMLDTLETGKVLIVDELDARLHPLLTRAIVSMFNSSANWKNAQLVFASHDTTLLDGKYFRRDQVWFTEKNQCGATSLYSLIELRGVRKEASFGKDYILGKYGAIPFVGDANWLLCEANGR
jgi:hypothetical protein